MIALLAAIAAPLWIPVGVSDSRLRLFVDRSSVRPVGGLRQARVRIGSPGTIAGSIVLVFQDETIDCRARTWRMTGYEAQDAAGAVVKRVEGAGGFPTLAAMPGTIGERVIATVCAL